jgi:hypothetical protein
MRKRYFWNSLTSPFQRRFGHKSGRNGVSNLFKERQDLSLNTSKDCVKRFFCLQYKIHVFSSSMGPTNYATTFRGRTDHHSVPFWLLTGTKWCLKYICVMSRCVIEIVQGQRCLISCLYYKLVIKRVNCTPFLSGTRIPLWVSFGCSSGRNSAQDMFCNATTSH